MTQAAWKHRILLIFNPNTENEVVVPFYYATLEQAGMLTYLLRRCLHYVNVEIVHNVYNRNNGYVTAGEPYHLQRTEDEAREVRESRRARSNFCITVTGCQDISGKPVDPFEIYTMDILDAQILDTLITKGVLGVKDVLTLQKRNKRSSDWETAPRSVFSPAE